MTGEAASVPPSVEPAAAAVPSAMPGASKHCRRAARPAAAPAAGPAVMVEAVEIEGSMVFVAGSADPGRRVRVYANSILLGDAVASPQGASWSRPMRDLPVGDYIIRVDVLDADGATVVARAAVPFEREPGETIAAVAPAPELGNAGGYGRRYAADRGSAAGQSARASCGRQRFRPALLRRWRRPRRVPQRLPAPALPEPPAAGNVPARAAPSPETPSTPSMRAFRGSRGSRRQGPGTRHRTPTAAEAPATAPAGDSAALPGARQRRPPPPASTSPRRVRQRRMLPPPAGGWK